MTFRTTTSQQKYNKHYSEYSKCTNTIINVVFYTCALKWLIFIIPSTPSTKDTLASLQLAALHPWPENTIGCTYITFLIKDYKILYPGWLVISVQGTVTGERGVRNVVWLESNLDPPLALAWPGPATHCLILLQSATIIILRLYSTIQRTPDSLLLRHRRLKLKYVKYALH